MTLLILVTVVYGIVEMAKIFFKDRLKHFVPIISIGLGMIITLLTYIFEPGTIPYAENFLDALVVGASCGLSSTGCNQILKHVDLSIQEKKLSKTNSKPVVKFKDIDFQKDGMDIATNIARDTFQYSTPPNESNTFTKQNSTPQQQNADIAQLAPEVVDEQIKTD